MEKIKVLFTSTDRAGVHYWRILNPALQLNTSHNDKFHVEINQEVDPNDMEYLKQFQIIQFHRGFGNLDTLKVLKKEGVKLVMDIDDYWELDKTHPYYVIAQRENLAEYVINNIKEVDAVTTTTELFADEIRKYNKNVLVVENSINPSIMPQFANKWEKDPNGKTRIVYIGGSSHYHDFQQLNGVFNYLDGVGEIKDKYKILLAGWDTRGNRTEFKLNEQFLKVMQENGLWNQQVVNHLNKTNGDIDGLRIPQQIKDVFRGQVIQKKERPITAEESVYFEYEKILTDNHKIIKDENYKKELLKFRIGDTDDINQIYGRRWTKPANSYAKTYNECDISLAPLIDHKFNRFKSNLKLVEAMSRKIPVICSDMPPYNVDGIHMKNSLLVENKKNSWKDWAKSIKKLIKEPNLREDLGNQLYEDFKDKYDLAKVTKKGPIFMKI
ncbi:MAG: glycosyltransferase [bacterium]